MEKIDWRYVLSPEEIQKIAKENCRLDATIPYEELQKLGLDSSKKRNLKRKRNKN